MDTFLDMIGEFVKRRVRLRTELRVFRRDAKRSEPGLAEAIVGEKPMEVGSEALAVRRQAAGRSPDHLRGF